MFMKNIDKWKYLKAYQNDGLVWFGFMAYQPL